MKVNAFTIPPRTKLSNYPSPFKERMKDKVKRQLGDFFHITKFGVNLTILEPGGESALLHRHSTQEEFIYILEGEPTLITEDGEECLAPGDCVGFTPSGPAHQLVNKTSGRVVYLEIGDRDQDDEITYPRDDLQAVRGENKILRFLKKNGEPYGES